ncbi:hypothetical protein F4808DRAFT_428425 [Astrocystis sublimbata]|nr:hypothetical protein F4808DRAFT_428425 [Astrocystis sublimbata]
MRVRPALPFQPFCPTVVIILRIWLSRGSPATQEIQMVLASLSSPLTVRFCGYLRGLPLSHISCLILLTRYPGRMTFREARRPICREL